jgi:hypothetical protein
MASYDLVPAAKRPCPVSREQLVDRLNLEGVSVRNNVRLATLLDTANAHGLLALAPEPQVDAMQIRRSFSVKQQTIDRLLTHVSICIGRRVFWTCQWS